MYWPSLVLPKSWRQRFWRGQLGICNICTSEIRDWKWRGHSYPIVQELDIVGSGRRKADCPVCGSSDRDRLVWEYLQSLLTNSEKEVRGSGLEERISVLHVAPERCISDRLKSHPRIDYVAVDLKHPGYWYPAWVINADISVNFSTRPLRFDFILCNHVLEHVKDDASALRTLISKLNPQGQLIITVPRSLRLLTTREVPETEWERMSKQQKINFFGQSDHRRIYGIDLLDRWREFTKEIGGNWREIPSKSNHSTQKKYCLNPKERLIVYFRG